MSHTPEQTENDTIWITEFCGTGRWENGPHFTVATELPVTDRRNTQDLANDLMMAMAKWSGVWTSRGNYAFVSGADTLVEFTIDGPARRVDASWWKDGVWVGKDGVDVSNLVPAVKGDNLGTVRP